MKGPSCCVSERKGSLCSNNASRIDKIDHIFDQVDGAQVTKHAQGCQLHVAGHALAKILTKRLHAAVVRHVGIVCSQSPQRIDPRSLAFRREERLQRLVACRHK